MKKEQKQPGFAKTIPIQKTSLPDGRTAIDAVTIASSKAAHDAEMERIKSIEGVEIFEGKTEKIEIRPSKSYGFNWGNCEWVTQRDQEKKQHLNQ